MRILPPKLSPTPFKKLLVPDDLRLKIVDEYKSMKFDIVEDKIIYSNVQGYNVGGVCNLNLDRFYYHKSPMSKDLEQECFNVLTPIVENWCGIELEKTAAYGIRSYIKDSFLRLHRDQIQTHILSCIIFVDENCNKKWPLDFFDHEFNHHKVFFEHGEMLLYESLCVHGRMIPFDGKYYRNMYFHWKPKFWNFNNYVNMRTMFFDSNDYLSYYSK
jgi:prolyl 4-hydroxylase